MAANVENTCVAGIASILESGYSIYYYVNEYIEYEEEEDLAWAFTYVVTSASVITDFDCSNGFNTAERKAQLA